MGTGQEIPLDDGGPSGNRRLTASERARLNALLAEIRVQLDTLAAGDQELRFALNRRLFVRLTIDERGSAPFRRKLKAAKFIEQAGRCALCPRLLELKGSELDRRRASLGYTAANTRLVHHECHVEDQRKKGFSDTPLRAAGVIFVEENGKGPGVRLKKVPK